MSLFLRLLEDDDKGASLEAAVQSVARAESDARVFDVEPTSFEQVPGAPFALVPTLCVGMPSWSLRGPWRGFEFHRRDAEGAEKRKNGF